MRHVVRPAMMASCTSAMVASTTSIGPGRGPHATRRVSGTNAERSIRPRSAATIVCTRHSPLVVRCSIVRYFAHRTSTGRVRPQAIDSFIPLLMTAHAARTAACCAAASSAPAPPPALALSPELHTQLALYLHRRHRTVDQHSEECSDDHRAHERHESPVHRSLVTEHWALFLDRYSVRALHLSLVHTLTTHYSPLTIHRPHLTSLLRSKGI